MAKITGWKQIDRATTPAKRIKIDYFKCRSNKQRLEVLNGWLWDNCEIYTRTVARYKEICVYNPTYEYFITDGGVAESNLIELFHYLQQDENN